MHADKWLLDSFLERFEVMKYALTAIILTLMLSAAAFAHKADSIRSIDFSNFTYPGSRALFPTPEYETTKFTLRQGKSGDWRWGMTLWKVVYGDVTGDGIEEAIVILSVNTDGSAAVNHVYIYTLNKQRPKFLWGFESGDRAWGGLRKVYAKDGGLVIELWGKGTRLGGDLVGSEFTGLCCPKSFTRSYYQWQDGSFRQKGEAEILSNPMAGTNCYTCLPDYEKDGSQ